MNRIWITNNDGDDDVSCALDHIYRFHHTYSLIPIQPGQEKKLSQE